MEPWRTVREAIPKGKLAEVARQMHVSADYVRRWRRNPESSLDQPGTGMSSPLSRILQFNRAVFLINPNGPSLIVEHIALDWEILARTHGIKEFQNSKEQAIAAADLLTQATEAVNTLNLDGVTEQTLVALIRLRDAADEAVQRTGKSLFYPRAQTLRSIS